PANTMATARLTRTNVDYGAVSVASEILQLRSKELMRQTVSRVGADKSYQVSRGLREHELYKDAPIRVEVAGESGTTGYQVTVTPKDMQSVSLAMEDSQGKEKILAVPLNQETETPLGMLTVTRGESYGTNWFGTPIRVTKYPLDVIAGYFIGHLGITQMEEDAELLQLS